MGLILFGYSGRILGLFLGSIFGGNWAIWVFIFTNPIFGCRVIFGNSDFIQILITKYETESLKAMGKVSI